MTWNELKEHDLLIYLTSWCPDCHRLKKHLDEQGMNYREVDIDTDADAAKTLQEKTGKTAIPYVEIDGKHIVRGWHSEKPGKWNAELFLQEIAAGL